MIMMIIARGGRGNQVGTIIGKGGEVINRIRQDAAADLSAKVYNMSYHNMLYHHIAQYVINIYIYIYMIL